MIDSIGTDHIPRFGSPSILNLGFHGTHALCMKSDAPTAEPEEIRRLVAKNIALLVPAVFGPSATAKGIKEIRAASGLTNGTVGRMVTPDGTNWNVSMLELLAKALKVQPWQLLLPDLTATREGSVVSIEGMKARQWPFPSFRRDELETLTPTELERLEKTIRSRIQQFGFSIVGP